MKKLTYLTLFITGLLLGTLLSYFTLQKIIASRGGMGMHGFVDTAHAVLNQPEVMDLLICSKLAMINTNYIKYVINSEPLRVFNSRRIDEGMADPF